MCTIEYCRDLFNALMQVDDKDSTGRWLKFEEECGEAAREILIQYNETIGLRATAHRETNSSKINEELVDVWLTYIAYARPEAFPVSFTEVPGVSALYALLRTKNGDLDAVPNFLGDEFIPMVLKKLRKWGKTLDDNGLEFVSHWHTLLTIQMSKKG